MLFEGIFHQCCLKNSPYMWVRIPLLQLQDGGIGIRKAMWMLQKEVHHFLKNGGKLKPGLFAGNTGLKSMKQAAMQATVT